MQRCRKLILSSCFPLYESDLHELGEIVFLFARDRQNEYAFLSVVLGNQCFLHHRFSAQVFGILDIERGRQIDGNPTPHDFFAAPVLGDARIEPGQTLQMVIHDRETANRNCEIPSQQLQPLFNPLFAMLKPLAPQKRPPHTTRNAMLIPRDFQIDQQFARNSHNPSLLKNPPSAPSLPTRTQPVTTLCLSFLPFCFLPFLPPFPSVRWITFPARS